MNVSRKFASAVILAAIFLWVLHPCYGDTFTTPSMADAFVATGPTDNLSADNFGAAGALAVASAALPQGEFQTVIQFNLSGAESTFNAEYGLGQWAIQSIELELTSTPHNNSIFNPVAAGQFGVSLMQNNSWVEGTGTGGNPTVNGISYNSLENVYINNSADQTLGTFNFPGGTSGENSYLLGLASGLISDVQDGGDASLRLSPNDNNVSYLFSSREGASAPELVITAVPEPNIVLLTAIGAIAFCLPGLVKKIRPRLARSKVPPLRSRFDMD